VLDRLRERVTQAGADAFLVTHPANVRYLSGFKTPEDARVIVTPDDAVLVTDGRYIAQADEQSRLQVEIIPSTQTWLHYAGERLKGHTVAIEADHVTVDAFRTLTDRLGREPVPTKGILADFRLRKSPEELATLREAARITDAAFEHILDIMKAGRTEVEVALELERFMRAEGAEAKSFEIIVASGVRSAMPHGVASAKVIEAGDLVTLDFGARLDGYHADMTRAVAIGQVSDELRGMFDAVLEAQVTALEALAPGKDGRDIDAIARDVLGGHGLAEYFAHSLGHGVGLEIHEGPRLSKLVSQTLEPGMTVTVEPGVYLPGRGGVRIEDLTVITEGGYERLSKSTKEFISL
jgi:Xaa-Pro aminopeptidase